MSPFLSSPTKSAYDGSEFGLIPKHILRNKQQMKLAKNNSKTMKQQQQQENGDDNYSKASTTTSTTINSNNSPSSITVKDCPSPSNNTNNSKNGEEPTTKTTPPTGEEMKDILWEINKILDSQPPWNAHYKFVTKSLLKSPDAIYNLDQEKELLISTENYNIKDSAKRINQHYQTKYDWFGKQSHDTKSGDTVLKLTRMDQPICIKDLLLHQRVLLESGYIQLLPTRDLAGRAIIFGNFDMELYKRHTLQFNQILFYMIHSALEDYETCTKGIVLVVWNNNSSNATSSPTSVVEKLGLVGVGGDPFLQAWNNQSLTGIRHAYKISKLHYCCARTAAATTTSNGFDDHNIAEPYTVVERREHNIDMRIHKGSLQECLHGLVTYGIPSHMLPLEVSSTTTTTTTGVGKKNDNDNNKSDNGFMKWIDLRRRMESINSMMTIDHNNINKKDVGGGVVTSKTTTTKPVDDNDNDGSSIVLVPNRMDVLFGSNKTQQRKMTLQGNIVFHQLVFDNMEAYHDIEIDEDHDSHDDDDDDVKKEGICLTIWHSITIQNNGRFLQQIEEGQMWEALSKKQALVKISQALAFMCSQYYDDDDDESSSAANNTNQSKNNNNKLAKKKRKNGGLFDGDDPFDLTDIFSGVTQCWNAVQGFNNGDNKCW